MGTVEMLIITGTLIVVVAGGLAIFFWWRMQYGVWSQPTGSGGRPLSGGGTVISDDFDARQQRTTPPGGNAGLPAASTSADAAERLRLIQLGAVAGLIGGAAGASHVADGSTPPGERGSDGPNDLLRGSLEPPRPPDAGEPMTRPAESDLGEETKRNSGWSLGSVFGLGGSSDSASPSTEGNRDSGSSSDTGGSYDSGSSDSASSDSGSSDSGSSDSGGD